MDDPLWIGLCIWFALVFVGIILWVTIGEVRDRRHARQTLEKFDAFVASQQPMRLTYVKEASAGDEQTPTQASRK